MSDAPSVGSLLREARPDRLAEAVADYLTARHPGCLVEVLIADYRISGLWPLLAAEHSTAGGLSDKATTGRAFGSQLTVVEPSSDGGTRALVPMSVRGDRLGVLVVELPGPADEAELEELREVAAELAAALAVADRSTDRYRSARRQQRMTMAAEMQWDLLPGRALGGTNFLIAGQLEPAYAVCGDHFDWSLEDQRLTITTLNGSGTGLAATMLTMVAVNAMRNARRSGGNLIEQAELASETLFGVYGGDHHVATLLLQVDLATGVVTAIDAGSPRAFLLHNAGGADQRSNSATASVELDQQLPLGMFADNPYVVETFDMAPRDRLFVVSDGVHAAKPGGQDSYGVYGLLAAMRAARLQPATEAVGSVMRGLHEYHQDHDLDDDAVVVCLDWLGGLDDPA